ncbi:MAG: hypothetical protein V1799_15230 [bacterium]
MRINRIFFRITKIGLLKWKREPKHPQLEEIPFIIPYTGPKLKIINNMIIDIAILSIINPIIIENPNVNSDTIITEIRTSMNSIGTFIWSRNKAERDESRDFPIADKMKIMPKNNLLKSSTEGFSLIMFIQPMIDKLPSDFILADIE